MSRRIVLIDGIYNKPRVHKNSIEEDSVTCHPTNVVPQCGKISYHYHSFFHALKQKYGGHGFGRKH